MTQKISWGILGCARIARRGLIPGIQGSHGGQLSALASRDLARAKEWAAEFAVPRAYGSYDELLADPEIQAVYIPLPNELHKLWTLKAAAAGKHVLCDKPLAINGAEAEQMIAGCRRYGVLLMEGFMWRHHPRTTRMMQMIQNGDIGEVRLVRCAFSFDIDRDDWRLDPARGGGSLWDVGCYGVNTCRLISGSEPSQVSATAHWWRTGVDMTLAATLSFPDGVLGLVDCSFEMPFRCHVEVVGTAGILELPGAYLPDENPDIVIRRGDVIESFPVPGANQYAAMVDCFCDAIRAGRPLAPPAEDGLANMRALDAVLAAAHMA